VAIGASSWVLISAIFPVTVLSTVGTFLLVLAEPRGVAEAEAFKASGNYDKFFDLTRVPVEFDFPESNLFSP